MKKFKKVVLPGALALSVLAGGAFGGVDTTFAYKNDDHSSKFNITFNQEKEIHVREFAKTIGASVNWDGKTRTVTLKKGDNTLVLVINSKTARINGESVTINPPAKIVDGKTMVSTHLLNYAFDIVPVKAAKDVHWSYEGDTGAEFWNTLHPDFAPCEAGKEQSPIDIDLAKVKLDETIEDVKINYSPTQVTVQNNGHTIQANDPTGNNTIVVEGETYKLLQVHFHIPSENTINGKHFEMEGHLVHINENGGLAVLGFMIEVGEENKQLAEVFAKMPAEKTKQDINLDNPVDLLNILPEERKTFRFNGSLTTPPCSEGVKWIVLETPISISQEQLDAYREIFPVDTNRPTQPLYDREVHTH